MWVKTWCSRYAKIAKQNISQVFHGKALPTKYLRKPTIVTLHIPIMCFAHDSFHGKASRKTSREIHFVFNRHLSLHTLSHTQPIQ